MVKMNMIYEGQLRCTLTHEMAASIPQEKHSMLEAAAYSCPVHKSLHPDAQTPVQFIYP